jgi:hypothetical protein
MHLWDTTQKNRALAYCQDGWTDRRAFLSQVVHSNFAQIGLFQSGFSKNANGTFLKSALKLKVA